MKPSTERFLFVSPTAGIYGSERSMLSLLNDRNLDAAVACPPGGPLHLALQALGVPVYNISFGLYRIARRPDWHIGLLIKLTSTIRKSKCTTVVINLDGNSPIVTLAALLCNVRLIRFCRFEVRSNWSSIEKWSWRRADIILCPSYTVAQQVSSNLGGRHRSVYVLYESVDVQRISSDTIDNLRRTEFRGCRPIIGYVGRLHREKRVEIAINVLSKIRVEFPDANLVLVGSEDNSDDGRDYLKELKRLVSLLGLSSSVNFMGYQDASRTGDIISCLDVFVLPSDSESFGRVLAEAWSFGVPTVAFGVGGCLEITEASGGGLLAKRNDVSGLAEHTLSLLRDSDYARTLGNRGQRWVRDCCNPKRIADRFKQYAL
ncbi:glycosyltransferase family 4 protein [Aestuariivirga sp.]|uniref:glycosyltransferase family 4 protein n=1 Tax=Aestuariivirga sp. TaxID=2650926 RepID=UPI003BA8B488